MIIPAVLAFISTLIIIFILAKMVLLNRFSTHMHEVIDELSNGDGWRTKGLDVEASYNKLARSMPWSRNFSDMIVYESR